MAKDTRVFKVTRTNGRVQYCSRAAVSGMFGTGYSRPGGHTVATVEATNPEATEGWTDVTAEFRNPEVRDEDRCKRHRAYTGRRKPGYRWYSTGSCTCWKIYGELHPSYPRHSSYCGQTGSDPEYCNCKMTAKILG